MAGKLNIDGAKLAASVGCNSMGGEVTIDGETLTIGSLMTTEMACLGALGDADAALAKVLTGGPRTMAPGEWKNVTGALFLRDAGLSPEPVPSGNPGGTVVSPPDDPLAGLTMDQCMGILPADQVPGAIGGSGSGSSPGSAGSGGGTSGSGGTTTEPAPGATAGAVDGGPAPVETAALDPIAPPPAPDASSKPAVDPGAAVTPDSSPLAKPAVLPGGRTPTLAECLALVARMSATTSNGAVPGAPAVDGGVALGGGETVQAMDKAIDTSSAAPVVLVAAVIAAGFLVLAGIALVLRRRSRPAVVTAGTDGIDAG